MLCFFLCQLSRFPQTTESHKQNTLMGTNQRKEPLVRALQVAGLALATPDKEIMKVQSLLCLEPRLLRQGKTCK